MSPFQNGLSNINLDEVPLPAASYNELPNIDDMRDIAVKHAGAHARLLGLITARGLADCFSVHLVHKHFSIPDGRVMVYEKIRGPSHPEFVLCSPRDPTKTANLRGLYFTASSEDKMAAYEYTTEEGEDLSAHADFVAEFSKTVLDLGVQRIFALTAKTLGHDQVLTEFEMSDLCSTVLVTNPSWIPSASEPGQSTSTDWIATPDYDAAYAPDSDNVPGIVTLKCTETKSNGHYNFTCSKTRGGTHYQKQKNTLTGEFMLNGEPVPEGSEAYAVISRASALVEAF